MSFYINNTNQSKPGPICGNAMNGLCEKVLIETKKIFDACVSRTVDENIVLTTTDYDPATPTLPLTFISAESTTGQSATISNLTIERLDSTPNYANVSCTVTIPVTVSYRDANSVMGQATSTIAVQKSVVLFVPQPSASEINVEASAVFSSTVGTYTAENTFTVSGCVQIVLKVASVVDVLVPSYGYPVIPPCQASQSGSSCPGTFEKPLYPTATTTMN